MSDHIPECLLPDFEKGVWVCCCAQLRAFEQRIHAQHLARDLDDIRFGREEGIREAWEAAVNVRNQSPAPFAEFVYREVLPAIDALRSRPNA